MHQSWYICNQLNKLLNTSGQGHLLTLALAPSDLVLLNSLKIISNCWKLNWIQSSNGMGKSKFWGIWVTWPRWLTSPLRCIVKWTLNSSSQELRGLGKMYVQMMTLVDLDLYKKLVNFKIIFAEMILGCISAVVCWKKNGCQWDGPFCPLKLWWV